MNSTSMPEKACETIKVRVTPTQHAAYKAASNGNVSGWIKQMANCKARVATRMPLTKPAGR